MSLAAQLDLTAYRLRPKNPDLYTALVTMGNAALSTPLAGHTDRVWSVAFSPDGRTLATGSTDKTVRLWDMTDPAHPTPLGQPLTGHTNQVYTVVWPGWPVSKSTVENLAAVITRARQTP